MIRPALAVVALGALVAGCGGSRPSRSLASVDPALPPPSLELVGPGASVAALTSAHLALKATWAAHGAEVDAEVRSVRVVTGASWPTCTGVSVCGLGSGCTTQTQGPVREVLASCPHVLPHELIHALGIEDASARAHHTDPRWGDYQAQGVAPLGSPFGDLIHRTLVDVYGSDPWEAQRSPL